MLRILCFVLLVLSAVTSKGQLTLTTSDLPIVVITPPGGQTINDAARVICYMGVNQSDRGQIKSGKHAFEINFVESTTCTYLYSIVNNGIYIGTVKHIK